MYYKVIDIAKYIINYCNDKKYTITNTKLNFLLYFVQASFIQDKSRICFYDKDIHCYPNGPVIPSIHKRYRMYGCTNIPKQKELFFNDETKEFGYREIIFTIKDEDKTIINEIIEQAKDMSCRYLEEIVFSQYPFYKNYVQSIDTVIPIEDLYCYFRNI